MKGNLAFILLILTGFFSSCEKDPRSPASGIRDLVVPSTFGWTNAVSSTLTLTAMNSGNLAIEGRVVELYDDQGIRISRTAIHDGKAVFKTEVPSRVDSLTVYFPMTRTRLIIDHRPGNRYFNLNLAGSPAPVVRSGTATSPSCEDGCTQVISGDVSSLEIKEEGTYCLTGNLNGGLTITQDASLRICGNANITWTSLAPERKIRIIVTPTGSLISNSFFLDGFRHTLENFGTVSLANRLTDRSSFINHGTMTVEGLEIAADADFTNDGIFLSQGDVTVSGALNNSHLFRIAGTASNLTIGESGRLQNDCRLSVDGNLGNGGHLTDNGYVRVGRDFRNEGPGLVILGDQGMLSCANLHADGSFSCSDPGGFGAIRVDNITDIGSRAVFTGHLDLCDPSGIENDAGNPNRPNLTHCAVYIPVGDCNPEGAGAPSAGDRDGDGIVDDEDDYPDDPAKAFNSIEPYTGFKTWAFEDCWPEFGDFDYNDLVLSTRIRYVLASSGKPVEATMDMRINTLGSAIGNGIAFRFDGDSLPDGNPFASLYGNGVTLDPANDGTIVVSRDIRSALSYTNDGTGPKGTPQEITFGVTFAGTAASMRNPSGDFFLFRTADRGHEIHMPGRPATSSANPDLFGTYQDASDPRQTLWYRTRNGVAWGITLILGDSDWNAPREGNPIDLAYPYFKDWVLSAGENHPDWTTNGLYDKCFHF